MSTHPNIRQIRNRMGQAQVHKETYRGQGPHSLRLLPTKVTGGNVVALEQEIHPLHGLRSAYYISMTEKLEEIASPLRRWLINLVYWKWDWFCGERHHDMGIFTDRDVAEEIAAQKRKETGKAWSVKELPVNGLLCEEPVQYGFYSFPGSKSDHKYRNRIRKFAAIPQDDLQQLAEVEDKLGKLQDRIEGTRAKAT